MRRHFIILFVFVLSVFSAACGTKPDSSDENSNAGKAEEESREEHQDKTDDQAKEKSPDDQVSGGGEDTMIRIMEQNIQFDLYGEQIERTAFLQESTDYSFYVLEGFSFKLESPNTFQVFFEEDHEQFMRISSYPETEMSALDQQAKEQVQSFNEENVQEFVLPEDSSLPDETTGYQTSDAHLEAASLIIPHNNKLYFVEIQSTKDFGNAFYKMIETIE